ncbi:MAG: hypothetical protein LBE74_03895 [Treponema sp.]|jgi:hypothetical protein|nr:hypothetical protein [Treponema sp.]
MGEKTDWMSGTRDGQSATAKQWVTVLNANGTAWGVPSVETAELTTCTNAADAALTAAKNETTRTPVATAQCKTAFEALTAKMWDIKKRYFYTPPLTGADTEVVLHDGVDGERRETGSAGSLVSALIP